jgi:hypothetical protein
MYTKQDLVRFGSYLLSEDRAKRVATEFPDNMHFPTNARQVSESDFEAVWPPIQHELTQEDLDVNGPVFEADGTELQAGDIVEISTEPSELPMDIPTMPAPDQN